MTKLLIPSETTSGECRVSATPEAVKKLKSLGCDVYIESSAGKLSGFSDLSYEESGGTIINNLDQNIKSASPQIFWSKLFIIVPPDSSYDKSLNPDNFPAELSI